MTRWAAFLDRDGVLNEPVPHAPSGRAESPHRAEDVRLTPGAAEAVRLLHDAGAVVVVVSNQPSAAKGTATEDDLRAVHDRVRDLLAASGARPDDWRYCLHHPEGVDPALSGTCDCRKPAPGMLLAAAEDLGLDLTRSWIVGDSSVDIAAGRAAGCGTVLVEHPQTGHRRNTAVSPDATAADILAAARWVATRTRATVPAEPSPAEAAQ